MVENRKRVDVYICIKKNISETEYKVIYRYKDSFKKIVIKTIAIASVYSLKDFLKVIFAELKEECEIYIFTNDFIIKNSMSIGVVDSKKLVHQLKSIENLSFVENIFNLLDRKTKVSKIILTDEYKKSILQKKKNTTNKTSSVVKKPITKKKTQKTKSFKSFNAHMPNSESEKTKLRYLDNMSEDERRRLFEEKARTYPTDMGFRQKINKNRKWRR